MHGLVVLSLRSNRRSLPRGLVARAIEFAKAAGREDWVGRLLVDPVYGRPGHAPAPRELEKLLKAGNAEQRHGRSFAAERVYRAVWESCARGRPSNSGLEQEAATKLGQLIRRRRDPAALIEHLKWKYSVLINAGDPWRAIDCLVDCASVARGSLRWDEYAAATDQQGLCFAELGRPDIAVALHRHALRVTEKHSLADQQRISAANLAECLRRLDRFTDALRASERALRLCDLHADPEGFISVLHNHHLIERGLGRLTEAARTLRRCGTLARKFTVRSELVKAAMARGSAAWDREDFDAAEEAYREALRLSGRFEIPSAEGDCRYNLALLLRKRGNPRQALRLLTAGPKPHEISVHAMHHISLVGILAEASGLHQDAVGAWKRAAEIADELEDDAHRAYYLTRAELIATRPDLTAEARANLADAADDLLTALYAAPAPDAQIQRRFDRAREFFRENQLSEYEVQAFDTLAARLTARGDPQSLDSAAQASIASVLTAAGDRSRLEAAMERHARWVFRLDVSPHVLRRLKSGARRWLRDQAGTRTGRSNPNALLAAFDAAPSVRKRAAT
jgi:tetratricopeptide (TPR) repeat protein